MRISCDRAGEAKIDSEMATSTTRIDAAQETPDPRRRQTPDSGLRTLSDAERKTQNAKRISDLVASDFTDSSPNLGSKKGSRELNQKVAVRVEGQRGLVKSPFVNLTDCEEASICEIAFPMLLDDLLER